MSGIEIAGFLLGAVPILISAIEHYNDGLDPLKAFIQWKGKLSQALRNLWHQHNLYYMTLCILLKEVTTAAELHNMMMDPRSSLWTSGEIGQKIRTKLGVGYMGFLSTIEEIEDTMTTLSSHLNIDRASRISRNELEAVVIANPPVSTSGRSKPKFEFHKRLDFTMKRRDVARLLERLQVCNERLDEYLQRAEKLDEEPATKYSRKSTLSLTLPQIQEYANSLHCVLSRAWACSAHTSHCANLLLEHRMVKPKRSSCGEDNATRFTVSFLNPSLPSRWQEAEIRIIENTVSSFDTGGRVGFVISPPMSSSASAPDDDPSRLPEITDMCSTIQQVRQTAACLGFSLDTQGRLRGVYPVKTQCSIYDDFITLEMLLTAPPTKNGKPVKLSPGDCYLLAVTLASSFLQLHTTPWIQLEWTREDIVFPAKGGASGHTIDVQRPFITQTYSPSKGDSLGITSTSDDDGARLLKLGTMLLEIFCGQRIEDRRKEENPKANASPNDVSDVGVLRRWIRAKEKEGSLSWASKDAISHCIACFADPRADLHDSNFRQSVIDKVVVPLLDELHHWQGSA